MFDPQQWYDQQTQRLYGGGTATAPPPRLPALGDDEEESALGALGRKVLGGVGYVGGLLDKFGGGRAVRGVLGGHPDELLSILPGSDTLGLTDESRVVHGRDLLENAGLVGHGVPGSGLDAGDVAGFGLDVALDPSTYFGNWLLKPAAALAGKAAMKLPGVARATEALAPVGRGLTAMFDPSVRGTTGAAAQEAMRGLSAAEPGAKAAVRKAFADAVVPLRDVPGSLPAHAAGEYGAALEGLLSPLPGTPLAGAAGQSRALLDGAQRGSAGLGIDAPYRENFLPRAKTAVEPGAAAGGGRGATPFDPFNRNMIARDTDLLGDLPKAWIDPLTAGPEASIPGFGGMTPLQRQAALQQSVLFPWEDAKAGLGRGQRQQLYSQAERATHAALDAKAAAGQALTPAEEAARAALQGARDSLARQSGRLADWLGSPEMASYAGHGLPVFGGSPFGDVLANLERHAGSQEQAKALYGLLESAAAPAGRDTVPLADALAKAGHLDQAAAKDVLARRMGVSVQDLGRLHVPAEVAADVGRAVTGFATPTALEPVLRAADSFTGLFRGLNAALLPTRLGRFSRNLVQQLWGMFVGGHYDPTAPLGMGLAKPVLEAHDLFRAGPGHVLADANTVPGLAHLSPAEATRELQKEAFAWGVAGPGRVTGKVESSVPGALHAAQQGVSLPGDAQPAPGEILSGALPRSWEEANPLNLRGVGGRQASRFAPARAGQELDALIDDATRGGSWLALRRQGLDAGAAAREVDRVHYNYGNLAGFEKAVMRRAFPFYSWARQNLPAQLRLLWESPGGKTAQAIRATGDLRQKEGFLPPDIAEGIGLPVGEREGGTQRYLTSLGLPFEDLSDVVTGRGLAGDAGRTLGNFMAQANPLLKAPVELATGQQLVSGRQLADLYGPTGNVLLDQAVMNAPGSSLYTGTRTLFDPRKSVGVKAANLLTPAKFTDVDMEKRKDIAARELVTDLLRDYPGVHTFTQPYVKPQDLPSLPPEAAGLYQLFKSLEQKSQERAREEKRIGVRR